MATRNKLIVPGAQEAVDQMKYEIAKELGVNFGRTATAQENERSEAAPPAYHQGQGLRTCREECYHLACTGQIRPGNW